MEATSKIQNVNLINRGISGQHSILDPYIYTPSIPAAVIGAVLFPGLSIVLTYQYFRHRSWFFWASIIGVLMLDIGFISRIISATDVHEDLPFLISFLMILLAPSFLAAACYSAFSRVLWFSCPSHALNFKTLWCFPRWITPAFVAFDLLSFVIQFVGAALISRDYDDDPTHDRSIEDSERKLTSGRVILVLGLILQMSCFASFAVIAMRYFAISKIWRDEDLGDWKMWRKVNLMINVAAALITFRAIFRTVEIPHDRDSGLQYLQANEWCFWIFDAVPIFATLVVFTLFHPGCYLPRSFTHFKLNKSTALQQKDEIRPPSINEGDIRLRSFEPGDFGNGARWDAEGRRIGW